MKASELKRWLKQQGCSFSEGARHTNVFLGNRYTTLPRHPSQEISTGTLHEILKRLGLKMK